MSENEKDQQKHLEKFLKSRKSEDTKKYTQLILEYLSKQPKNSKNMGWVRSRQVIVDLISPEKIPNASTLYKLLKDLENPSDDPKQPGHRIFHRNKRPLWCPKEGRP